MYSSLASLVPTPDNDVDSDRELFIRLRDASEVVSSFKPEHVVRIPASLSGYPLGPLGEQMMMARSGRELEPHGKSMVRDFGEWRHTVTRIESDNAGRLMALCWLAQQAARLNTRRPSPQCEVLAATFVRALLEWYRASDMPDNALDRREWARKKTRDLGAMPMEYRRL